MDKYQEALYKLKGNAEFYADEYSGVHGSYVELEKEINKNVSLMQKLVDRATPMKVIRGFGWKCPNEECERKHIERVSKQTEKFCEYCGQALDWSNDNAK